MSGLAWSPAWSCAAKTKVLLGDRGYDADWLRQGLADRGIAARIPSTANRKAPIPHDTALELWSVGKQSSA